jgi:hypothetical protein
LPLLNLAGKNFCGFSFGFNIGYHLFCPCGGNLGTLTGSFDHA